MPDLDDFDLDRTPEGGETQRPYRPSPQRPRGSLFPALLALFAVTTVGLLAVLFIVFHTPEAPEPTPSAPAASPPAAVATPSPSVSLPPLDDSDAFVRELGAVLGSHPELARWLARTSLIRTLTAVVANIADGESPRPHLDFLAPKQRFRATARGRGTVPDPAGFSGYDKVGDAVGAVDAQAAAAGYRTLEPLFEAAYRELGHPQGGFGSTLDRAIRSLLAVPVLGDDVALVPHAIGFRYVDRRLESLTAAQKQFLRMGPRNVRLVQAKLREIQAGLAGGAAAAR
jgi:hypothetical protein